MVNGHKKCPVSGRSLPGPFLLGFGASLMETQLNRSRRSQPNACSRNSLACGILLRVKPLVSTRDDPSRATTASIVFIPFAPTVRANLIEPSPERLLNYRVPFWRRASILGFRNRITACRKLIKLFLACPRTAIRCRTRDLGAGRQSNTAGVPATRPAEPPTPTPSG